MLGDVQVDIVTEMVVHIDSWNMKQELDYTEGFLFSQKINVEHTDWITLKEMWTRLPYHIKKEKYISITRSKMHADKDTKKCWNTRMYNPEWYNIFAAKLFPIYFTNHYFLILGNKIFLTINVFNNQEIYI